MSGFGNVFGFSNAQTLEEQDEDDYSQEGYSYYYDDDEGMARMRSPQGAFLSREREIPLKSSVKTKSTKSKGGKEPISPASKERQARLEHGQVHRSASGYKMMNLRFAPDTLPGVEADIAVSITRHKIKDNKYIEYTVVVHQKGYEVHALTKRYKQFEALDALLKMENKYYSLPKMPRKRYFKTNKWDDEYVNMLSGVMFRYLEGYISILLLSCFMRSGALGSPDLLLSYFMTALALHDTIILIITHLSTESGTI